MSQPVIPAYEAMMNPIITVLKALGDSATIEELNTKVIEQMQFTDTQLSVLHDPDRGTQTEIEYRLAWARTYLKKFGILDNSSRGVWSLTSKGRETPQVNPQTVRRFVAEAAKKKPSAPAVSPADEIDSNGELSAWRDDLMAVLLHMAPDAFERLAQRILRESGFTHVEVTGRSGDGGIDGRGMMRLGGILSFHVIFQCKRYKGSVTANHIRDFRGAMVGRSDKGLFITTGNYTKDAIAEATRDGAPPIDLIDGDQLVEKLKELNLGISKKIVQIEEITVDKAWFSNI